jgi:acetyl-CoA carboxylase biotin carboxyl carrier protein
MAEKTASATAEEGRPGKKTSGSQQQDQSSFDMDELRELMELVNEQGFTDFEFENENIRVRLSKAPAFAPVSQSVPTHQVAQPTQSSGTTAATPEPAPAAAESDEGLHKITSPIVGTFYRSPGPDKEPYVKEGSNVSPESVVCIVEAMKLMNEIQAEVAGEVVKIYVENGQPVEFGQPLFGIKK